MPLKSQTADPAEIGSKPSEVENKVTVSSIARRRLAVVVTRLKMSETVSDVS
jgi:U3 small nucleolar ribonucleoprotein protein IMP3